MRKIIYLLLLPYFLILLISCSTQKKNENIVDVKEAQVQVEQVEDEVQEASNNSNILDTLLVKKDSTIIEETNFNQKEVIVDSETIKKEEDDDDEDEKVEGLWSDNIKLTQDSVLFSAEGDSAIVRTSGDWWILYGFTFYESLDIRSQIGAYDTTREVKKESHWGIDVEYEWLKVYVSSHERIIKIKVDKNTTGKTRYWNIELGAGDYFDRVHCQQPSL